MCKVYWGSPPGPEPTAVTRTISPTPGSATSTVIRKVGLGSGVGAGVSVGGKVGVGVGVGVGVCVGVGAIVNVAVGVVGSGVRGTSVGGGSTVKASPTPAGVAVGTTQATNIKAAAANRYMNPRLPNPATRFIP